MAEESTRFLLPFLLFALYIQQFTTKNLNISAHMICDTLSSVFLLFDTLEYMLFAKGTNNQA